MNTIQGYMESPEVRGLAKSTRELYGHALHHAEAFARGKDAGWLSDNISRFAEYLEGKKLSGKSVQQYLTCTKIYLKWAGHPVEFVYKISNQDRQENKRKRLDRWFTEEDIDKCLSYKFNNVNGDELIYHTIVRLLVETGARVGEIAGIKKDDVHLDEGFMFIQGKTEPRPVFFSLGTAALLSVALLQNLFPDVPIFPDAKKIKTVVTRMLEDLGLKKEKDGRGPHTFRHYTATYLFYEGNMRIEDLAFLLGDKVDTIVNHYLHPTPAMLRKRVATAMGWDRQNNS